MKKFLSIALAIVMIFALSAVAFAEEATEYKSPVPQDEFKIDVSWFPGDGSLGDAVADQYTVVKNTDGTVTITANPKANGEFTKWEIDGKYEVVSGDLTTPVITVRPASDLKIVAYFKAPGGTEPTTVKPTEKPSNPVSPKTGDPLFLIIALAALALGTGIFAVKKIKE